MEGRLRCVIVTLLLLATTTYTLTEAVNNEIYSNEEIEQSHVFNSATEQENYEWDLIAGNWYSIQTNCFSCTSSLSFNDDIIQSDAQNYSGQANNDGKLSLVIDNPQGENFEISAIVNVSDNHPNTRPSPQTEFQQSQVYQCPDENHCIDKESPVLASTYFENHSAHSISGILEGQQIDYFGFPVSIGQTVEVNLEHANANIELTSYFQNSTNEVELDGQLSANTITNEYTNPQLNYIDIVDNGRLVIKVSSAVTDTIWSVRIILHNQSQASMIELTNDLEILGHSTRTVLFEIEESIALSFSPIIFDVDYSYQSLVDSEWLFSGNGTFSSDTNNYIFPLPGSTALRLIISAEVFYMQANVINFDDINSGLEAPSLPPILASTDNSSWPILDVKGPNLVGEFTHSIRDSSDVYRIEIDAWEDSIHFVKIEIEGNINEFEIELIEKDQEDWSEVESKIRTTTFGKLSVALEISRGTHFFRISLLNSSTSNVWGEYIEPTKYTIITTYELVDEGDEPWFPPDDNAQKWGNIARWFMGILFLLPALYLGMLQVRKKNYAREMLSKKQRLQWLKSRLDEGISPKQNRRELAKSLDAVATLDWKEACQTWGEPDVLYRTEDVAIASWKLDPRIAEVSNSWPIIIGVYIIKGNWEIAALKLDSPEGEPWEIQSVTPRFLHSGYEVFLDTMTEGNKTFLSLELLGSADSVDIELNGRMDGKPQACRASKSLHRDEEE